MGSAFAIETERLILRDWRTDDLAPMHAICTDPEVMAHLGPPMSADEVAAAMARQQGNQARLGHCFWIAERAADGAVLGFCGLKRGPEGTPIADKVEIGWRLGSAYWGQGYAREAALAALAWGWAHLPDEAIWAITVPANVRSWGLMERIGMKRHEDLAFEHPAIAPESPLRHCITYSAQKPSNQRPASRRPQ
jgi:RimJ/RimL family protein N-acetyltransferase